MSARGNFPLTLKLQVMGDAEVNTKLKGIATSLNQISPAASKATQSTNQTSTALKSTGQAATSSSTGVKTYGGALTSLGSATTQARTGTEAFTGSLNQFSAANTAAKGGLNETNTVVGGLVPTMGKAGTETTKTGTAMQKLTNFMQGNRGLIFSVTMLGSGILEAIGMYQGWIDASEKLTAAKQKEADLLERGMEGTKEYGDAVRDTADAQRGYNFITRFTIQSFGDLVPMSLMLSSSLLDLTSKFGGATAAKTKLAAAGSKLVTVFSAIGTAIVSFTTRHPLIAMLTLASAAVLALIKNFGGFRDMVNQVGVEIGKLLPGLQNVLALFGVQANQVLDTADAYLTFGGEATAATSDVEKQVLKTGDATKLSYNEQIELMHKMGDEAENLKISLGAHLQEQQQAEQEHNEKYKQFAEAISTGNQDIMQSLGLTADEFKTFSDEFQENVEAMDEKWNTGVESILANWDSVKSGFGESVNSTVGEINKLQAKIDELTAEQFDLDEDKDLEKNQQEINKLQKKIDELRGTTTSSFLDMGTAIDIFGNDVQMTMGQKITKEMEEGGNAFITLGEQAKTGIDAIRLGIISGDFEGAINTLSTAIDGVPPQYQKQFTLINSIIHNSQLTYQQRIAQIISEFGSLENAFQPMINGAYQLNTANAEIAASLDEVAVAARNNMTDISQAEGAWNKFIGSLKPAQKDLPIITDLQARLEAGTITYAEALQEAEAAGRAWSVTMGKDVAASIKDVEKSMIDMGDGTTAMVANVNGQMVNLGRVSNTELGNVSDSLETVDSSMSTTAKTANTEIANEATSAVAVFGKDGKFHFGTVVDGANTVIDIFKAVNTYANTYITQGATGKMAGFGETMKSTSTIATTETGNWGTAIETFKNNAVKWLGEVQTTLDNLWKSAQERLSGTNFQNLLPSIQEASGEKGKGGMVDLNTARQMSGIGGTVQQQPQIDITAAVKALDQLKAYANTTTTQISSFFTTMESSIKLTMTRIGASFATVFAPLTQQATMNTSQASAQFVTMETSIKGTLTRLAAVFPTTFTTLYTYATQATGQTIGVFTTMQTTLIGVLSSLGTAVGTNFVNPTLTAIGGLASVIQSFNTQFSAFANSIATLSTNMGNAVLNNFVTPATNGLKIFTQVYTAIATGYQAFASAITKSSQTAAGGVVNSFVSPASNGMKTFVTVYNATAKGYQAFTSLVVKGSQQAASAIKSFASSAVSSLNKIASAAKSATSALNSMAAAARKAAQARSSVGLMHGGQFIKMAQHGFSGVINQPTKYGGVRMGEGFKPELVTVQPLTRGTGNTNSLVRAGGGLGGSGSNRPIIIENIITLDGKVIDKRIRQVALGDYGYQV